MSSSWVTLIAAVIAAAAAVFNVIVTKRGTSTVELQKWRRQQVGELGARVIATVHPLVGMWQEVTIGRAIMSGVTGETLERAREEVKTAKTEFYELMRKVELAAAELDLVAGRPVPEYTSRLLMVLGECRRQISDFADDEAGDMDEMTLQVHVALFDLVDVMRSDLGIEKRVNFSVHAEYRNAIFVDD